MNDRPPLSWTVTDVLNATGGQLAFGQDSVLFSDVSIDSRSLSAGALFVAIQGKNHDGHAFVAQAVQQGAGGILIHKDQADAFSSGPFRQTRVVCIAVDDSIRALGDLAAYHRQRSDISIIAITGSNGKTTTKEMTAAVVSRCFATLSSAGNFNNEIGLPLSMLKIGPDHRWAVLELGMNRPGEIRRLAEICSPDIAVITNIGTAHLAGVGSVEGVMHAKGELLEKMKPGARAVLNGDDAKVLQLARRITGETLFFGTSQNARVRALGVGLKDSGVSFELALFEERVPIDLKVTGKFMVLNALAAAAAGHLAGVPLRKIQAGLNAFTPLAGRMNVIKTDRGIHIIDDSYNANPDSMAAAITSLVSLKGSGRKTLVAGDMHELGEYSESMHRKIGALSSRAGVDKLYVTGQFAPYVVQGAKSENNSKPEIFVGTREEILKDLTGWLQPGDWVLVKGSRAQAMETIVSGLTESLHQAGTV
ncbi:MAG: UDP-N-acetylmuramoyl-tripeptide--D-alanyl-D-alanine ligase [Desulfobacterales bacterium]|nr:UDP-N-acetylmuramoyl-tripeptide--D-alanyl-D-alanine ligase [Desulfobacterales bacterium]